MSSENNKIVWIDFDNSPHVLFFNPIIKELEKLGINVIVTARDYAQVLDLVALFKIEATIIGKHYGKNFILKLVGSIYRSLQLAKFIYKKKPDFALSHGSRSQFLAAKLLGIKTGLALDYEYIKLFPFLVTDIIYFPKMISKDRVKMKHKEIFQYSGIKEDVYVPSFRPSNNQEIQNFFNSISQNIIITIRPPATLAHYYTQKSKNLFEYLLKHLSTLPNIKVIFTPRSKDQESEIKEVWQNQFISGRFSFLSFVMNGLDLIWNSDLVISGGGTMIREAAALNVPAYSTFGSQIGAVDHYLEFEGRLILLRNQTDIKEKIKIEKRNHQYSYIENDDKVLSQFVNKTCDILN